MEVSTALLTSPVNSLALNECYPVVIYWPARHESNISKCDNIDLFRPVIDWLGWAKIVGNILAFLVLQRLKSFEMFLLDSQGILEYHPVDGLLTATSGEGPVVVEILVHQDRQEVYNIHIMFSALKLIIR